MATPSTLACRLSARNPRDCRLVSAGRESTYLHHWADRPSDSGPPARITGDWTSAAARAGTADTASAAITPAQPATTRHGPNRGMTASFRRGQTDPLTVG